MKYTIFFFLLIALISCNRIESHQTLTATDIARLQGLNILDKDEHVILFYSEYKKSVAGNYFTDKRMAAYWLDERDKRKTAISYAFYNEIKALDTIFNTGLTYCPYILVTQKNGKQFKVCVDGNRKDVSNFFTIAMKQWDLHK